MAVSRKDVVHVASLAKMSFADDEIEKLLKELNSILEYMEMISKLDVTSIPPTSYVQESQACLRNDGPVSSLSQEEATGQAPQKGRGCFKVPRVV